MRCIMEVGKVNSINTVSSAYKRNYANERNKVSFKAAPSGGGSNLEKKFWFMMRRLADEMKDITEVKNAIIAAIGTGIIAPAIILVSPGKGDQEDKDKKFIQAIRQPISAALALGFQVPATILINHEIDKLSYEKKMKFFKDSVIGDLIPTEKYLAKGITKEELSAWMTKFDDAVEGKALKEELIAKIEKDYKEVGLELSDEVLNKRIAKDKEKFLREKIASQKHAELSEAKIKHILENPNEYSKLANLEKIKDIDLVTEDFQNTAKHRYKAEYSKLEKEANLSIFDKIARLMGFETKKTKQLATEQNKFAKEKGLEILKKEQPEIFTDKTKKLKTSIEAYEKKADKMFNNKKFWISLLVNLFMVSASCFALNWLHPRVNKYLENRKAEKDTFSSQKVEVK